MKRTILLTAAILATSVCRMSAAEQKFDPAARAAAVAPFVDDTTYAVVHADLTRIEPGPVIDLLAQVFPVLQRDSGEAKEEFSNFIDKFIGAGCKDIYFTVNLALFDPNELGYMIIPVDEKTDIDALMKFAPPKPRGKTVADVSKRVGNALVFAAPGMMARLDSLQADERPGLAKAFEIASDTDAQVILAPPAHVGKVLDAMMPTLPEQIGGGSTDVLTRGVKLAALGVDAPPEVSVRLVIQSEDAKAAEAVRKKLDDILRRVAEFAAVKKTFPALGKSTDILLPKVEGDRLVLHIDKENGTLDTLLRVMAHPVKRARANAERSMSMNNLKRLGIAMHNYYDVNSRLPGSSSFAGDGTPLLSWRVHILPFIDQQSLYERFHLDEPWDSEHNKRLIAKMPETYRSPKSQLKKEAGRTSYLRPRGDTTTCPDGPGLEFKELTDGPVNTIMFVEADDDRAVIWTKPEDLPVDLDDPGAGLGGFYDGKFCAATCDGAVHLFKASAPADVLRALFTRAGGEKPDWDEAKK